MKKSNRKTIDCLGLGIMPLDLLFSVESFPKAGTKINASNLVIQGGGPIPNVMIGLRRLGFRTALISAAADDLVGNLAVSELKKEKVGHQYIIRKGGYSDTAVGLIEDGSGRRTMILGRDISVRASDLTTDKYPLPRIVHMDGRDMAATMKLARWGKKVGASITFDIGSMRNDVSEVFPLVDHLIVADSYAFPFTGSRTAKGAVKKLQKLCKGTIVITEGIRGAIGVENNKTCYQPAFKVSAVDTTGAGDAFHTGYFYGLLKSYSFPDRLKLGAVVAALKCTKPGARQGLPTINAINRFMKSRPAVYA